MAPRKIAPKSLHKNALRHRTATASTPVRAPPQPPEIPGAPGPNLRGSVEFCGWWIRGNLRTEEPPRRNGAPRGLSGWDQAGRPGPGGNYLPQIVNWISSELSFMLLVTVEVGGTSGFGTGPLWVFSGT